MYSYIDADKIAIPSLRSRRYWINCENSFIIFNISCKQRRLTNQRESKNQRGIKRARLGLIDAVGVQAWAAAYSLAVGSSRGSIRALGRVTSQPKHASQMDRGIALCAVR